MYGLRRKCLLGKVILFIAVGPAVAQEVVETAADEQDLYREVVRDRYPSGNIKVRREVARTVDHNYVNHGECLMWDEENNFLAAGRFELGKRVGVWKRIHQPNESELFKRPEYRSLFGPFTSQAEFQQGRLHGLWTMTDGEGRTLFEIPFVAGQRHGTAKFFHPNGQLAKESTFRQGHADVVEKTYDEEGNLISQAQYMEGRMYAVETEQHFGTKATILEAGVVYPPAKMTSTDDWWNAKLAVYQAGDGEPMRHGPYSAFHKTGKIRVRGAYHMGQPVGEFVWYHSDGEVAIRGSFVEGEEDGMWHWWHPSGMKMTEGKYRQGERVGQWLAWTEDGSVTSVKHHTPQQTVSADSQGATLVENVEQRVQLLRRSQIRQDAAQR